MQGELGPLGLSGREGPWGPLGENGDRGPKGEKGHLGLMVRISVLNSSVEVGCYILVTLPTFPSSLFNFKTPTVRFIRAIFKSTEMQKGDTKDRLSKIYHCKLNKELHSDLLKSLETDVFLLNRVNQD